MKVIEPINRSREYQFRASSKSNEDVTELSRLHKHIFEAIGEHMHLISDSMTEYEKGIEKEKNLGKMLAYSESLKYFVESLK